MVHLGYRSMTKESNSSRHCRSGLLLSLTFTVTCRRLGHRGGIVTKDAAFTTYRNIPEHTNACKPRSPIFFTFPTSPSMT